MDYSEDTFDHYIINHGLDAIEHWRTIEILHEIWSNGLQDTMITSTPFEFHTEEHRPLSILSNESKKLISQLNKLFSEGWEILLSTTTNHGGDGGTLLMVYLVDKDLHDKYWRQYDKKFNGLDATQPGIHFEMEFVLKYHHKPGLKAIWSGAH